MGYEAIAMYDLINGNRLDEYAANSTLCFNVHTCMDEIKKTADIKYN